MGLSRDLRIRWTGIRKKSVTKNDGGAGAAPLFREVDLSRAVPPYTVRVTFRYRVVRPPTARLARVGLAEDPEGRNALWLTDDTGVVTVRLQVPSRVYVALEDPRLHLNLWVVECVTLRRFGCGPFPPYPDDEASRGSGQDLPESAQEVGHVPGMAPVAHEADPPDATGQGA